MTVGIKWFIACAAIAAGEATAFAIAYFSSAWPAALLAVFLSALTAFGLRRGRWYLASLFFAGMALAWIAVSRTADVLVKTAELNRGRPVTVEVAIPDSIRCFESAGGGIKAVFPFEIRGIAVIGNIYLEKGVEPPKPGDIWSCTGWVGRESKGGFFGKRRFWVRGKGSSARFLRRDDGGFPLKRIAAAIRRDISERVGAGAAVDGEIRSLNRALLLGDRSGVGRELRAAFADSGTAHLFAVSGLHVLVIAKFFSVLLSLTGFPSRFKALALIPLVWLYVLVVGAGPSSVRAGVMATFYFSAPLFWRKSDSLSAWAQTFILIHTVKPENLVNTASQLSFVVMLGLVVWNRVASGLKWGIADAFAPSFVAWASGVPVVAATFSVVTPGGLVANLIAVPMACFSVVLTAAGVLFSYVSYTFAGLFSAAAYMTTSIMVGLARTTGAVGWSSFEVEKWSFVQCALWYGAVACCIRFFYLWRIRSRARMIVK